MFNLFLLDSFASDDWKQFAREIRFSRPGEFFYYAENRKTGLAYDGARNPTPPKASKHVGLSYSLSKWTHDVMFTPGATLSKLGAKMCASAADPMQGPKPMRLLEHVSKAVMFQCKDCGDCSLPDIAFLCPESQCAKNQRNGPCGGTRDGRCEVDGYGDCIWLRAYERLKHDGNESNLLEHAPVVQNQGLRGTSAWANFWLGRDHAAKRPERGCVGVGDQPQHVRKFEAAAADAPTPHTAALREHGEQPKTTSHFSEVKKSHEHNET